MSAPCSQATQAAVTEAHTRRVAVATGLAGWGWVDMNRTIEGDRGRLISLDTPRALSLLARRSTGPP